MFQISKNPIKVNSFKKKLTAPEAGALVAFEGCVRGHNNGKNVILLEYETSEALARKEVEKILQEAKERFAIAKALCVHRVGKLKVGDLAVWIGVTAGHRAAAFGACRYIIDELKIRLPIWKKEHYADGQSSWVNFTTALGGTAQLSERQFTEDEYYSKQMNLPEVGKAGQERLKGARVLVVGAGGLGTPALTYLASCGVGTLGICEFDNLEASNLHRQILYSHEDIGRPKARLAAKRLQDINPFIEIRTHEEKLTADNVEGIIREYDLIVDGSDNFPTKFLLNDAAVLNKKPLIQASVYQFEGQLLVYRPGETSACLRCLWPQIPDASCVGVCATVGILGVVPGVFGLFQAAEAIKFILGIGELLSNEIFIMDFATYRTRKLKHAKDPGCPVCGKHPTIVGIRPENYTAQEELDLDLSNLPHKALSDFEIIDVREPNELAQNPVSEIACTNLPFSRFQEARYDFSHEKKYLIFCESGMRSRTLTKELRDKGIRQAFSLLGGRQALKAYFKNS